MPRRNKVNDETTVFPNGHYMVETTYSHNGVTITTTASGATYGEAVSKARFALLDVLAEGEIDPDYLETAYLLMHPDAFRQAGRERPATLPTIPERRS